MAFNEEVTNMLEDKKNKQNDELEVAIAGWAAANARCENLMSMLETALDEGKKAQNLAEESGKIAEDAMARLNEMEKAYEALREENGLLRKQIFEMEVSGNEINEQDKEDAE